MLLLRPAVVINKKSYVKGLEHFNQIEIRFKIPQKTKKDES